MSTSIPEDQQRNYELFREFLATALLESITEPTTKSRRRNKTKPKRKKTASLSHSEPRQNEDDAKESNQEPDLADQIIGLHRRPSGDDTREETEQEDDLADFTDYIATEIFTCLPTDLKTADYHDYTSTPALHRRYVLPLTGADIPTHLPQLDPSVADSLAAYGITDEERRGVPELLAPVLTGFLGALATPPPPPRATHADAGGCEICGRDWVGLSYHHLIPRFVHAKAVRRGWHRACDLQSVAWLCGACHRFVHRFADHEALARRFYTVDRLLAEDEVRRWAAWVARLRWKGR
ncbi:putative proline-specific permease [Rosellinia necatrix]|uniref:Putative proline-specific permease n=1 Tax=Rosellinia necatrix TaxID=77044 RepID=A0A1W2TSS3_ROSNE|nr:putative proline-specific permease [Rosellinia necatrix]